MLDDRRFDKHHQLKRVADAYVKGLQTRNFETIPYHPDVVHRAPIVPGGVHRPSHGRDAVFRIWWEPLQPLLPDVRVSIRGYYYNESSDGVVLEADITLKAGLPEPVTVRVADRLTVDDDGLITDQENHFDPRDITNPGWYQDQAAD